MWRPLYIHDFLTLKKIGDLIISTIASSISIPKTYETATQVAIEKEEQEIAVHAKPTSHCTFQGFHDYTEAENVAFHNMMEKIQAAFELHGFCPFYPRPVEPVSYLCKNAGGEEITKQVFGVARLADNTLTNLGMPFDRTVALASWILRHATETKFPMKRWNNDISWRGEHASPGRYRAFFQCDVDIINTEITPIADAEVISTMYDVLKDLDIGPFTMLVNHISIAHSLVDSLGVCSEEEKASILRIVDKMEKLPREEIRQEILEIIGEEKQAQLDEVLEVFSFKGSLQSFKYNEKFATSKLIDGVDQLSQIFMALEELDVDLSKVLFCPGLVRGLEYYSGVVAETFLDGEDPQTGKSYRDYGSIASGGRYDNLVGSLASRDSGTDRYSNLKGTGMSIGASRLFDILCRHEKIHLNLKSTADVLVGYRTQNQRRTAIKIAKILRENGIKVDLYSDETKKVKHQLKYANDKGIPCTILVMEDQKTEEGLNSFLVKDMQMYLSDVAYKGVDHKLIETAINHVKRVVSNDS
ncbi:MAG: histidine--tRNA ligase family protein [Chlamydiae bacterium]|nr:histidine--tRNA ligase family protein [Chlamydiota bacterium]